MSAVESLDLKVLEGVEFSGRVNVSDEVIAAHVAHAIRLGHPQVRPQAIQGDRVCIVAGGPSLEASIPELRQLVFEGAKIVALNGAAQWCVEHNFRPSAHILLDARPHNARFLEPAIPKCRYLLASQCHPYVWTAATGRDVWVWHAVGDVAIGDMLKAFYRDRWMPIGHGPVGGTTVLVRAIALLRTLGFVRFELFGADSCVGTSGHHAYRQPENDHDHVRAYRVGSTTGSESRLFYCTTWHLKQLEDFLQMIRATGDQYMLRVHGDGLLAYALQIGADAELQFTEQGVVVEDHRESLASTFTEG